VTAKERAGVGDAGLQETISTDRSPTTTEIAPSTAVVKFHPLADMFPLMEGEEFDALVADIKANGLRDQIIKYHGMILDGRNRYRACLALGWTWGAIDNMSCDYGRTNLLEDDAAAAAYVISVNIHRRHLTPEQKRELIANLLKAQPATSNLQVAKQTKTDDKTVASVRRELERRSEIPNVPVRTDTKGRKQPAKKRKRNADDPEASAYDKVNLPKSVTKTDEKEKERIATETKRLVSKLIELDRDLARAFHSVLSDVLVLALMGRVDARGFICGTVGCLERGLDDDDEGAQS
jgi:hypothetical protein